MLWFLCVYVSTFALPILMLIPYVGVTHKLPKEGDPLGACQSLLCVGLSS